MEVIGAHCAYLNYLNRRPSSIDQRRTTLWRVQKMHGPLLELDGDQLQAFVNQASLGVEARAAAVSHLRGFYRWAIDERLLDHDPSLRLRRPKRERRIPRPMPDHAAARALSEAPDPIRQWLFLAAYAGLRACEIAQLCGRDFLLEQRPPMLIIRVSKGGDPSSVPLAEPLRPVVAQLARIDGWCFPKAEGYSGHVTASQVQTEVGGAPASGATVNVWGRVAAWCAALALAVGLFPTVRAIVTGSDSPPNSTAPSQSAIRSDAAVALLAGTDAAKAAPHGSRKLLLVGNSVAFDLGPAFAKLEVRPPIASLNMAIPACNFPPLVTATYRNPATLQQFVLRPCHPASEAIAMRAFRPAVALWVANDAPEPWFYRGNAVRPCAEPYESLYARSLREEISRLHSSGAKVVITTEAYVRYVQAGGGLGAVALSDRAVDCANRIRRTVATQAGAQLVDLFDYTCPAGKCRLQQDGVTLRPDGLHYQGAGADIVARWVVAQIR